jgi:hypothetical protein
MALMFTFVLFGTSVIWKGLGILGGATLLFVVAVFAARPIAFIPALLPAKLSWKNRSLIAWFGPRGLSSLLLVLLPVFARLPQSEQLLTICCLVVLFSVVLHGLSPSFLVKPPRQTPPPLPPPPSKPEFEGEQPALKLEGAVNGPQCPLPLSKPDKTGLTVLPDHPEYISIPEIRALQAQPGQVVIVDARTERTYGESDQRIPGAVRVEPEHPAASAGRLGIPKKAVLAILCA